MKIRIFLSVVLAISYMAFAATWNAFRSPIACATTAAQLDDTTQSWVIAHIVRNNFVENSLTAGFAILLAAVWLIRSNKKTHE